MKISYVSPDWSRSGPLDSQGAPLPGGSNYYRCYLPGRYLLQMGHEVSHVAAIGTGRSGELYPIGFHGEVFEAPDIMVLQRIMKDQTAETVLRARATGQKIVVDVDDWFEGVDPTNNAFAVGHPRPKALAEGVNRKTFRQMSAAAQKRYPANESPIYNHQKIIAAADLVTVSTPYLKQRLSKITPHIQVLRNAIDIDRWQVRKPNEKPTVGWVGALGFRSHDVETLSGMLGPFVERRDLKVHHSGSVPSERRSFAELAGVNPQRVSKSTMAPITSYPQLFDPIDIGLVPLSMKPFNFAKSAIKGMEYSAKGIPFICAPTPSYLEFLPSSLRWLAPKNAVAWTSAIERLLDPIVYAETSRSLREHVASWSIERMGGAWEDSMANLEVK